MIEDNIDKISFSYVIMSRAMSPFAKLLWLLLILLLSVWPVIIIIVIKRQPYTPCLKKLSKIIFAITSSYFH